MHCCLPTTQAAPIVRKDGFIASNELQKIADANHETKANLQKKIRKLTDAGYVRKHKHGIVLTSKRTIHRKLNLHYTKKGKEHTPFIKLENMNSVYRIELLRLFFLIKQIRSRYLFQKNGRSNQKCINTAPDYFELSLHKICQRGKYNCNNTNTQWW